MYTSSKKNKKNISAFILFLISALVFAFIVAQCIITSPKLVNLFPLEAGKLNEAQRQTIMTATELNKLLITINTVTITVLGFYLKYFQKKISNKWFSIAYAIAVILLPASIYFAVRVYSQIISELAQEISGLIPGQSRVLHLLEMAFWTSFGSISITLLTFLFGFIEGKSKSYLNNRDTQ